MLTGKHRHRGTIGSRNGRNRRRDCRIREKLMQFFSEGRYVANVVDGKVNFYGVHIT
jgi:hypothetical protein